MDKTKLVVIPALLMIMLMGWFQGQSSKSKEIVTNHEKRTFETPAEHPQTSPPIIAKGTTRPTSSQKANASQENLNAAPSFMTKEELEAKVERLKQAYKDNPNFDSSLAKREKFESESINEKWAAPREAALFEAFKSEPFLQGKNLKSVHCRSSYCRVEIYFDEPQNINGIINDVYRISSSGKYKNLFVDSADMGVSLPEKVVSVYFTSDHRASLF